MGSDPSPGGERDGGAGTDGVPRTSRSTGSPALRPERGAANTEVKKTARAAKERIVKRMWGGLVSEREVGDYERKKDDGVVSAEDPLTKWNL